MIMFELSVNCNTRTLHWRGAVYALRQNIATNFKHKAYVRFMQEITIRNGRDGRRTASISCHWVRIEMTSDKLISTTEDFGPWLTAESLLFVVLVCLLVFSRFTFLTVNLQGKTFRITCAHLRS